MSEIADLDAERALIGAVLQDSGHLARVRSRVRAEDFHARAHGLIWSAALELFAQGQPVDHLTLADRLKARNALGQVGGVAYLMALDQQVPVAGNLEGYAVIVVEKAKRRRLVAIGRRLVELGADEGQKPEDVQIKASAALAKLGAGGQGFSTLTQIGERIGEHIRDVEDDKAPPAIPTGIKDLDRLIAGLQPTLLVFGARTGVGKSAVASTLAQNVARQGYRVGIFSLEDEDEWLGWRYLAAASGVNQFVLRYRKKTAEEWERVGNGLASFAAYGDRIIVDDRPGLNSKEIALAADDMVINHGVNFVILDHLSEVDHHHHRRERHDLNVMESLIDFRGVSKRHRIPFLALSQLNEKADDPKATPDLGWYALSKEVGKRSRVAMIGTREPDSDEMRIHVLKQTNGRAGKFVDVKFHGAAAMIRELEPRPDNVIALPFGDAPSDN